MTERQFASITQHPDFHSLTRRRARLGWSLTALMLAVYFGFIGLLAFYPAVLVAPVRGGTLTTGIVAGAAVIVVAFALTAIYVRKANREFDGLNARILKECAA